jgi:hypothetical protein
MGQGRTSPPGGNTPTKVSAMFYKAVVQSVLLYGSETWNLTKTALARLKGFHIRAAYRMAKKISLVEDQTMCGSTPPPAMCSKSVE